MAETIWKYQIPFGTAEFDVVLPFAARVVRVATQGELPQMWVLCDAMGPRCQRRFVVRGTGHEIPDGVTYVGTFTTGNEEFVWHVFDAGEVGGGSA